MVCWSLDFNLPVFTSTVRGLPYLHLRLRPPNQNGALSPPTHLVRKIVISREFRQKRPSLSCSLPYPLHTEWCLLAHSRHSLSSHRMSEWRSLIRQSQSIFQCQHKFIFSPVFSPRASECLIDKVLSPTVYIKILLQTASTTSSPISLQETYLPPDYPFIFRPYSRWFQVTRLTLLTMILSHQLCCLSR